eukprot:gene8784-11863_t
MAEFINSLSNFHCTFALSGNTLLYQSIYVCDTCNPGDDISTQNNICCCLGCSQHCHNGHDIRFIAYGAAYCDCGSSNCGLITDSLHCKDNVIDKVHINSIDGQINSTGNYYKTPFEVHSIASLKDNHNLVQTLKFDAINLSKLSKETFWMGVNDLPRCSLEALAHHIFQFHYNNFAKNNLTMSTPDGGFEWWVQIKMINDDGNIDLNHDNYDKNNNGVDLHYDKDENIAALYGLGVFPQLSTVTYLNDDIGSVPTIIFDVTSTDEVGIPIKTAFVSIPEIGKHISFDGRLLHGAPAQLHKLSRDVSAIHGSSQSIPSNNNFRITFLVNLWLNHHPHNVHMLPVDIVDNLNSMRSDATDSFTSEREKGSMTNEGNIMHDSSSFSWNDLPVSEVRVSSTFTDEEELGEWESIPFVSDKSDWGKSEDETGIYLFMWRPNMDFLKNYNHFSEQTIMKKKQSKNKNKTKNILNNNKESSKKSDEAEENIIISNSFIIRYVDDNSCARLEYEVDNFEDEMVWSNNYIIMSENTSSLGDFPSPVDSLCLACVFEIPIPLPIPIV